MFGKLLSRFASCRKNSNETEEGSEIIEELSEIELEKKTIFRAGILHIILGFVGTIVATQPFQYLLASQFMYGGVVQGFFSIPIGILYVLTKNDLADPRYALGILTSSVVSLLTSLVSVVLSSIGVSDLACACEENVACDDCEEIKQLTVYIIGILLGVIQMPFASWVAYVSYHRFRNEVPNVVRNANIKMVAREEGALDQQDASTSE